MLQDVYGNRYTYAHLGSVSQSYPVPKEDAGTRSSTRRRSPANDQKPTRPASAGRQLDTTRLGRGRQVGESSAAPPLRAPTDPAEGAPVRPPGAARTRSGAGGDEQILDSKGKLDGFTTFRNYFSRAFGLNAKDVRLKSPARRARA